MSKRALTVSSFQYHPSMVLTSDLKCLLRKERNQTLSELEDTVEVIKCNPLLAIDPCLQHCQAAIL
jgi:hypothetical protein